MRLALLGGVTADTNRLALSPKEQKEALAVEYQWMLAACARRELIKSSEVAEGVENILAAIRDALDAAPDRLARDLNLDGAAVEIIQKIFDETLETAVAAVERLMEGDTV